MVTVWCDVVYFLVSRSIAYFEMEFMVFFSEGEVSEVREVIQDRERERERDISQFFSCLAK